MVGPFSQASGCQEVSNDVGGVVIRDLGGVSVGPGVTLVLTRKFEDAFYLRSLAGAPGTTAVFINFGNSEHHKDIKRELERVHTLEQAIVHTMNPIAIDTVELQINSPEDVRAHILFLDGDGIMSQMSEDAATRVHMAYTSGIRYLTEILVGEGLW